MKIFAMTFAKNEDFFLPRWVRYYGAQLGYENLFVIDHDSTDLSTINLGAANVIRMPASEFSDSKRAQFASKMHEALISYFYDGGFVTDTDEFIVADPEKFSHLKQFIEEINPPSLTPIGIELLHIPTVEGNLQPHLPILSQRRHVFFNRDICKQSYSRIATTFGGGFHASTNRPQFNESLFLIHLKNFDYQWRLARQLVTRSWSYDSDFGTHARASLIESERFVSGLISRYGSNIAEGFSFQVECERAMQSVAIGSDGLHRFADKSFFSEQSRLMPESFQHLF